MEGFLLLGCFGIKSSEEFSPEQRAAYWKVGNGATLANEMVLVPPTLFGMNKNRGRDGSRRDASDWRMFQVVGTMERKKSGSS
jgi:hypothetical protein